MRQRTNHFDVWVGRREAIAVVLATTSTFFGCSQESPLVQPVCSVRAVSVSPSALSMLRGESQSLTASVDASNCSQTSPTWSSTNDLVVRVSSSGTVMAVAPGTVTVIASVGGLSGSSRVTVGAEPIATVPVATVSVAPQTVSLSVGQSSPVTATLRDPSGSVLAGRVVVWSSSNRAVGDVSATGMVTAFSAGTTTITASSEGRSASAFVTVAGPTLTTIVTVENKLIYSIGVDANGGALGDVPAESSRSFTIATPSNTRINFSMRRPTVSGREIGDPIGGYWDLQNPSSAVRLTVDNVVGTSWYFAPLVTNQTGVPLLMVSNWGLNSENRCNCTVPPTGQVTHLGYYRLYNNSNLTAFRSNSNYTGPYRYFYDFGSGVMRGSGVAYFTFDIAP